MNNAPFTPVTTNRTPFRNGSELEVGNYYRLIATGSGEIVDSEGYMQATDQLDRKNNRLMVGPGGACAYATPTSIWTV